MSDHNISAGTRWEQSINNQLESSNFGILCLTAENLNAPWLLFESGSLAKVVDDARVVPYRFNLKSTDVEYPLAQFQGVDADEKGTLRLLESINKAREVNVPEEQLRRLFRKWWPDLHEELNKIPLAKSGASSKRTEMDLLEEILQIVRQSTRPVQVPQPLPLEPVPPILWLSGRNIHNITNEEIAAMNDEDLRRYAEQLRSRWLWTASSGEEHSLESRMSVAEAELQERGLNSESTKTEPTDVR